MARTSIATLTLIYGRSEYILLCLELPVAESPVHHTTQLLLCAFFPPRWRTHYVSRTIYFLKYLKFWLQKKNLLNHLLREMWGILCALSIVRPASRLRRSVRLKLSPTPAMMSNSGEPFGDLRRDGRRMVSVLSSRTSLQKDAYCQHPNVHDALTMEVLTSLWHY